MSMEGIPTPAEYDYGDAPGLPVHGTTEIMTQHQSRPTPAEAVDRGVTPSSGDDSWNLGIFGAGV